MMLRYDGDRLHSKRLELRVFLGLLVTMLVCWNELLVLSTGELLRKRESCEHSVLMKNLFANKSLAVSSPSCG